MCSEYLTPRTAVGNAAIAVLLFTGACTDSLTTPGGSGVLMEILKHHSSVSS